MLLGADRSGYTAILDARFALGGRDYKIRYLKMLYE